MAGKVHKSQVTTADIARRIGLSATTVSMVLRGGAQRRKISPKTAQKVLDAARLMNYVPNPWARNLRRQRSRMVGVILVSFRWEWAEQIVRGMSPVLDPKGYTTFVAVHGFDEERARRELLSCLERRDEGVIMQPMPGLQDVYASLAGAGMPVVFIGDRPAENPDAHFVAWDSATDAQAAVRHLVSIGRKRIGFVGYDYPMPLNRARYEAYRGVLRRAGLPFKEDWVARSPITWSPSQIIEWSINKLFESNGQAPDALFMLNDGLAVPMLDGLLARGIRVPQEVAVIGMGDYPIAGHAGISLSTMREPVEELGRVSAQMMLELLADPGKGPFQKLVPCGELKVRRTTLLPNGEQASARVPHRTRNA